MGLFGPPNISKMTKRRNTSGLVKALSHKDPQVRISAAAALYELSDARAADPLLAVLEDEREHPYARSHAAQALGKLRDARAVEPISRMLAGGTIETGPAAVALGRIRDPRAVDPLIAALRAGTPAFTRIQVVTALGEIGDPRAVESVADCLGDIDYRVKVAACEALGKIGGPRAAEPLVALGVRAIDLPDEGIRALGEIGGPAAVELLTRALSATYRGENVISHDIYRVTPEGTRTEHVGFTEHPDARRRRLAAETLGMIGTPEAMAAARTAPPLNG